ncbi:MAG: YicC family protein [Candidatus Sumerlaeota bacterium]|nr:YicC family protein [Candidatus Sumerlaeota bacterium]
MLYSMTGFGAALLEGDLGIFSVEVRTVNNRFLDYSFRLPQGLAKMETSLREFIAGKVRRGRVDLAIRWAQKEGTLPSLTINLPILEKLYHNLQSVRKHLRIRENLRLGDLLKISGLYVETPAAIDEEKLLNEVKKGVKKALADLQRSREKEGRRLSDVLMKLIDELDGERREIEGRKGEVLEKFRQRLLKKIEEFNQTTPVPIEPARLEAEVLLFADRSDISEELARLQSHTATFRQLLTTDSEEPAGRPLEFLSQELLREVNTLGSKSHDTDLANCVLAMKNTLEKIREQLQNVE